MGLPEPGVWTVDGSSTDNIDDLGQAVVEKTGIEGYLLQIRTQAVAENAGLEEELLLMRT